MSELSEVVFDLSCRLRALEFRQTQREIDEITRRIELLEAKTYANQPVKKSEER